MSYVGTALRFGGWLSRDLTASEIRSHYAEFVLNRFRRLGLLPGDDAPETGAAQEWLAGSASGATGVTLSL